MCVSNSFATFTQNMQLIVQFTQIHDSWCYFYVCLYLHIFRKSLCILSAKYVNFAVEFAHIA